MTIPTCTTCFTCDSNAANSKDSIDVKAAFSGTVTGTHKKAG